MYVGESTCVIYRVNTSTVPQGPRDEHAKGLNPSCWARFYAGENGYSSRSRGQSSTPQKTTVSHVWREIVMFPTLPIGYPLPKRILIADDHESLLRRVRTMLESQLTWEVCGDAVNGREAVAKAAQLKPDLVVLDFAMPQLDGLRTASEIRAVLPEVPIVMFTMYAAQLKQEVQKHGISCLVDKAESGALMVAIQELLGPEEPLTGQPSSGPTLFSSTTLDRDSQDGESGPITKAS